MSSAGSYGSGGGGGGVGNVKFLTGNSGGPVGPDLVGNINVDGTGSISVSGNAGTNTLTIELSGAVADQYVTESGTAVPVAGILNIDGMSPITTSATGDTVFIGSDGTVATLYECDDSTSAAPLSGVLNITGGTSGAIFTGFGNTITESFNFLSMADSTSTTGYVSIGGDKVLSCGSGVSSRNIFVGQGAGNATITGIRNSAVGFTSLASGTTAGDNTSVGNSALNTLTSGTANTCMGSTSLANATTASGNTCIGFGSAFNLLTGRDNTIIGSSGGTAYTGSESSNIVIGSIGTTGDNNQIRIGTQGASAGQQNACNIAGIYGSTVGGTNALVFIDNTGQLGTTGGTFSAVTSIDGSTIGSVPISGALTITGGTSGAVFATAGTTITESFDFLDMADSSSTTGYIQIGSTRVFNCGAGVSGHNTFVGQNAGNSTLSGTQNVCIGDGPGASGAGAVLTTGNLNTSCGYATFNNLGSGFQNSAFGGDALENVTTGHNNTACGQGALLAINTGSNNTGLGYAAGSSYTTGSEANNLCVGANVTGVNGESNTIRIGDTASATACYVAGTYGQAVGGTNAALFIDNTGKIGTTGGSSGGVSTITGDNVGTITGAVTLTGGTSGAFYTTSGGNTLTTTFTKLVMSDTTATTGFISLGGTTVLQAGGGVANNNIFVGEGTGNTTLSGTRNTAIGAGAMTSLTSATNSVAVGSLALPAQTSGAANIGIGYQALHALTTAGSNVAIGFQALSTTTTGTGQNVAVGNSSLSSLGTGSLNTAVGYQSGFNLSGTEVGNILIGNFGVAAESNAIRIGGIGASGPALQTTCYIAGIAGVTVANSAAVLINTANGQLGTLPSSRRFKENISDMGSASGDIYKLRPVKFNFKGDFNESYGLIAEDVEEAMPYLVSYDKEGMPATVKYHELPALLLNEISAHQASITELERTIQRLKLKIDELEGKFNSRVR